MEVCRVNKEERLQLENELLMTCSKAQAINKYIDELEESSKLSELWCKSQQENQKYKEVIDKAIEYLEEPNRDSFDYSKAKLLDILEEVSE